MNTERFEILAEAFGGDVARWPADERDAAAALMAAEPEQAAAILAQASALDDLLAEADAPRPSAALADRIVAGAPQARVRARWPAWLAPAGMGAGLAAACAAGVMLGAQLTTPTVSAPETTSDSVLTAVSDDEFTLYLDEEA